MRSYTRFFSSILALSSFAVTAHGHGGIPRGLSIEFQPNDPEHVVVAGADVGLFVSHDGGASWALSCYAAQEGRMDGLTTNVPLLVTSTGKVLSRTGWSLMGSDDGVCDYDPVPFASQVEDPLGVGVKRAADGTLLALTSTNTGTELVTELWRSDATGASFTLSGTRLGREFAGKSLVVSPTEPDRVYVGGFFIEGGMAIAFSEDAGAHWDMRPLGSVFGPDNRDVELIAVDPRNPDLLILRATGLYDPIKGPQQTIWFSSDAGRNWQSLHASTGPISGVAFSPDGSRLALGDYDEGLFLVDAASLEVGDAPVKEHVFSASRMWGITWNEAGLYAGLNEFGAADAGRFTSVGVSHDGGRSFSPFFSVCDVHEPPCESGSAALVCYPDFVKDYQVDSGRCDDTGSGGASGGTGGNPAATGGSGGAAATGGGTSASGGAPAGGGGGAADPAQRDAVEVSSCAVSTARGGSTHIVSLTLAASCALTLLRRRVRRAH